MSGWYRNVNTFNCAVKFGLFMMFFEPQVAICGTAVSDLDYTIM